MTEKAATGTKLEKIPIRFQLGDNVIDGAVIRPMTFQTFIDYITEAQAISGDKPFDAKMRLIRMTKQVSYYVNGTVVPMSVIDILKLPIRATLAISSKLDNSEGEPGKVIRDGDGIDKAITYQLGTPIPTGQGKEPITELEFLASTYGDIEDVLAADSSLHQTAKLISTVAKPLGTSLTLLPTWAINLITISDGMIINREILPRFLSLPTE